MKIRCGFVSNSSSSSFIINAIDGFSTVKNVAEYIMDNVSYKSYITERKTLESIDPDTPVHFNVGGEETYIRKVDNKIVIVTTQNITFNLFHEKCLDKKDLTEDFYRQFDFIESDEDYPLEEGEEYEIIKMDDPRNFTYFYGKFDDFNILKYNILGKHTYLQKGCPRCKTSFASGWRLKGGRRICDCQVQKYKDRITRKEKIMKINEK